MTEQATTHATNGDPTLESLAQAANLPITRPFEKLVERLGPQAVFGEPVRTGAMTVIPVAEVRTGFGFGGGQGSKTGEEGSGGGGGAGVRVTPRGYIQVTGDRVRYRPIRRFGPLALAGLALAVSFIASFAPLLRR